MNADPDTSKNDLPAPEPPAEKKKPRRSSQKILWIVIGVVWGLLILAGIGVFLIVRQGIGSQAAVTRTAIQAATQNAVMNGTRQVLNAQEDESATARAVTLEAIHADSTVTAVMRQSTQTARALGYFGPEDGALEHEPDDDFVVTYSPDVWLKNFVIEVTFINPYDSHSVNGWDYGIYFRSTGSNSQYRVSVFSDSGWHFQFVDDPDWTPIGSGYASAVNLGAGESNHLYLKVQDDQAEFRINDVLIAKLNVGQKQEAGYIMITIENFSGNSVAGYSTEYQDLRIEPLP